MATWDLSNTKQHVFFCNGSSCNRAGAEEVTQAVRKEISERGLDDIIHTTRTRCNGRCQDQCVVISYPQGTWYKDITPEDAPALVNAWINGEEYEEKVSHTYVGSGFKKSENIPTGEFKNKEKVKKVSKVL